MKKKRLLAFVLCILIVLSNVASVWATEGKEVDASTWNSEDFTYVEYEKLLYGCDYSRQFKVTGRAISGFSETGEVKFEKNKDLVIPSVDDQGVVIVGVADNAFKGKGIKSVTFPTGMMVDYDDTVTHKVTKRGNFVIADGAFSNNELTSVNLPEGVIACLPYAFSGNDIETVKLPKTIWWLETMSFARNKIKTVNFPVTCDFQLEMHGLAFAQNMIESVRLPDFTEVVNKDTFAWNIGKEPIGASEKDAYRTYEIDGVTYNAGVVYMYTDNAELEMKDRIHHVGKSTASQHSAVQKLIVNDGSGNTENPDASWNVKDFIIEGTVVKGLSESGIAKRAANKNLILPDMNEKGQYITEIASAKPAGHGLFAAKGEGFDSVYLPSKLKTIGNYAFQNNGLKEVTFPSQLETIGEVAFQTNELTSIILPDTVKTVGKGAFATNPKLERINLSKGMTEIPEAAFGCSDDEHWMTNLKTIEIHNGITKIGRRAFAGNNFSKIKIPASVKEIGAYAFSTKNYLKTPCVVELNEGLEEIGSDAFRNKVISEITLPTTVKKIYKNTFRKEYSDDTEVVITKVFVSLKSQYEDKTNFPSSDFHKVYLLDSSVWTAEDFTYATETFEVYTKGNTKSEVEAWVITGLSELGENKIALNKNMIIPERDPNGKKVEGIGKDAFAEQGIETLEVPEGISYIGAAAFKGNLIKTLKLPRTIMVVSKEAFASNRISSLQFVSESDVTFQMEDKAFAQNNIKAVQLPKNTKKVAKMAFFQNPGMEPVVNGNEDEKQGGIVYMYKFEEGGEFISHIGDKSSNVQKLIIGTIPEAFAPWGVNDFTYADEGRTITGLTDVGKEKIKENPEMILPENGPSGKKITALGDGENQQGIFVIEADRKLYTPSSVELPSGLKKIGKWTFALNAAKTYEAEMQSITLPDGLIEIAQTAFQNSRLTSIEIPDSVTTLGSGAFTGSGKLTSIKLSKNVKEIPAAAFNAASTLDMSLKTLVIPEGVETIGDNAFTGTHVEKLTLPSTLKSIGNNAFMNHQLSELEIPGSVKTIGNTAFKMTQEGYSNTLKKLVLNEGLEKIGKEAFFGSILTEVDLPSTVVLAAEDKGSDCIFGNSKFPANPIVVLKVADKEKAAAWNTPTANRYSHIVVYDNLVGSGWELEDFTYDEKTGTLTGWSESGHEKRKTLRALVLPEETPGGVKITTIGKKAFMIPNDEVIVTKFGIDSPNGMTSLVLPKGVTIIENEAFSQNALTKVNLTGLTKIGERSFYGNDLVEAIIPDTVTSLGAGAFATNDITNLRLSKAVTKIPQGAFSMNIRMEQIEIPDTVTEIGPTAFAGARLTTLTIPKSVEKIGEKAFHLHHLSTLTIPGNVKELGDSAFEGTFKATTLTTLILEEGVETIGKYAFKEALLETVHFPNSIKSVGEKPFLNNKGKDGSHVVDVTTMNPEHLSLSDETYTVRFIGKYDLADYESKVELPYKETVYTGSEIKPKVTIEGLVEGKDFTVTYKNNVDLGIATVEIKGIGSYEGTIVRNFEIKENPLTEENEQLKSEAEDLKDKNQELESEIDKLQDENEMLKAEIERLKAEMSAHKCPESQTILQKVEVSKADEKDSEPKKTPETTPEENPKETPETTLSETPDVEPETVPDSMTTDGFVEDEGDSQNKMIIGIVLGMIIGGSVVFLLTSKKKKQ